jgi:heme-degrading monooxygenase HmoA
MLRGAKGFLKSELFRESRVERRYRLWDFWRSHLQFEAFRAAQQQPIEELAQLNRSRELVLREVQLGAFYIDEPGEDWTDLTPA